MNKEEKFNEIISENSDRIRRICSYYNANSENQKDMYQEVLMNIWRSLDNFRGDSSISTWIYRVAVNTSLSYNNMSIKHMKLIVDVGTENLECILEDEHHKLKKQEEIKFEELEKELNLLSVIDKALISLLLEGLSMKEIADVIGIKESNVKVKIHRIKGQLRSKLKGGSYDCK